VVTFTTCRMYKGGKDFTSLNKNTLEQDQNTAPIPFVMARLLHMKVEEIEKRILRKGAAVRISTGATVTSVQSHLMDK
jgi:hypothetical protein